MASVTQIDHSLVVPDLPIHRFAVVEYLKMIETDILTEDNRVELLEGWIVPKMTRYPPHDYHIWVIHEEVFLPRLPAGLVCRAQFAIVTSDSVPEPDLAIVRGTRHTYSNRHPSVADIALVLEVSDSSLSRDRVTKVRLYARAGIAAYWIVNLVDRRIEVYTDPTGPCDRPEYRQQRDYAGADLVPFAIDGRDLGAISASEMLP